jgi:hypothetical protein
MPAEQFDRPLTRPEARTRRRFRAFKRRLDRPARVRRLLQQLSAYSAILAVSLGSYLALQRFRPEAPLPPMPLPEIIHPQIR